MDEFKVGDWVMLTPEGNQSDADDNELEHNRLFKIIDVTEGLYNNEYSFRLEGYPNVRFFSWAFINLGPDITELEKAIYSLSI